MKQGEIYRKRHSGATVLTSVERTFSPKSNPGWARIPVSAFLPCMYDYSSNTSVSNTAVDFIFNVKHSQSVSRLTDMVYDTEARWLTTELFFSFFFFFKSSGGWAKIKLKLPHFHVSDTRRRDSSLHLSRMKNQRGHWVCWMSTSTKNGLM